MKFIKENWFKLVLALCAVVIAPVVVLSAPSLGAKLQGKILLAVEDKGKTYYVHSDGNRYQITKETAQKIFEKLALGVKNSDLAQIPLKDVGINPEQAILGEKIVNCDYSSYINEKIKCDSDKELCLKTARTLSDQYSQLSSQCIQNSKSRDQECINTLATCVLRQKEYLDTATQYKTAWDNEIARYLRLYNTCSAYIDTH